MECHWIYICSFSRTKVGECHWIYSARLRLWNDIGFTQQDKGYGMSLDLLSRTKVMKCHWIYSAGLRLRNVIGFTQQD